MGNQSMAEIAVSIQRSALNTHHSALSTHHSVLITQYSALSTQHSVLIIEKIMEPQIRIAAESHALRQISETQQTGGTLQTAGCVPGYTVSDQSAHEQKSPPE